MLQWIKCCHIFWGGASRIWNNSASIGLGCLKAHWGKTDVSNNKNVWRLLGREAIEWVFLTLNTFLFTRLMMERTWVGSPHICPLSHAWGQTVHQSRDKLLVQTQRVSTASTKAVVQVLDWRTETMTILSVSRLRQRRNTRDQREKVLCLAEQEQCCTVL